MNSILKQFLIIVITTLPFSIEARISNVNIPAAIALTTTLGILAKSGHVYSEVRAAEKKFKAKSTKEQRKRHAKKLEAMQKLLYKHLGAAGVVALITTALITRNRSPENSTNEQTENQVGAIKTHNAKPVIGPVAEEEIPMAQHHPLPATTIQPITETDAQAMREACAASGLSSLPIERLMDKLVQENPTIPKEEVIAHYSDMFFDDAAQARNRAAMNYFKKHGVKRPLTPPNDAEKTVIKKVIARNSNSYLQQEIEALVEAHPGANEAETLAYYCDLFLDDVVQGQSLDAVKYCISHGAHVKERSRSLLAHAKTPEIFLALIDGGACDRDAAGQENLERLFMQGCFTDVHTANRLRDCGALNEKAKLLTAAAGEKARSNYNLGAYRLKALIETYKVPVDEATADGTTALMAACESNNRDSIKYLREKGADINKTDARGYTALMRCIEKNTWSYFYIIGRGIDINHIAHDGKNALKIALEQKNLDMVNELLRENAARDESDTASLMEMFKDQFTKPDFNPESVDDLIEDGHLDISAMIPDLMRTAVAAGRTDHIAFLVKHGGVAA